MTIIIYSINMDENTHTDDVYKAALIHAFMNSTADFDDMSYDIIERELKSLDFYNAFLESLDIMGDLYKCEVVH